MTKVTRMQLRHISWRFIQSGFLLGAVVTVTVIFHELAGTSQTSRILPIYKPFDPQPYPSTAEKKSPRETFQLWDKWQMPHLNMGGNPSNPEKYLVYFCGESLCGGWANRVNGIIISYIMANLTGRTFKVQIIKAHCTLSNYMLPNSIDWSVDKEFEKRYPKSQSHVIQLIDDMRFFRTLSSMNFTNVLPNNKPVIYLLGNMNNIRGLKKHQIYTQELSWMRSLDPADIYAALYKRLFKLSPNLKKRMDDLFKRHVPTLRHRLLCVHLRIGVNPSIKIDSEVRNTMDNVPKVWDFLQSHGTSDLDRFYVMSDSAQIIQSAQRQKFSNRLLVVPGTIVHVDRPDKNQTEAEQCLGLEKIILELHMLMNCDLLVRSISGLSLFAAAVRQTDDNLFCWLRNGTIQPCSRNDFVGLIGY